MDAIWKSIAAVAAAATIAAVLTGFPPSSNQATANASIQSAAAQQPAQGCEQRAWPYTQTCGQTVRIVTTDRLK